MEGRDGSTSPGVGGEPPGGLCFWNQRDDPIRNAERVRRLDWLFRNKYPDTPGDIDGPKCFW